MGLKNVQDIAKTVPILPVLFCLVMGSTVTASHQPSPLEPLASPRSSHPSHAALPAPVGGIDAFPSPTDTSRQPQAYTSRPSGQPILDGFCHPLNNKGKLSQGIRGITHQGRMEYAYDIATPIGTPVYAMRSGQVLSIETKYPDSGGSRSRSQKTNYVLIQHPDGYRSAYVHLQRRSSQVIPGTWVRKGQLIAFSGNSGWTTGPHLHVEVQMPSPSTDFTQTVPFSIRANC